MNGKRKCKEKNRVNVALLIPNPPQIHSTSELPMYGKAENKLVITVAPQNLICPHGSKYPIKAVAIVRIKIVTPKFHVSVSLYEPKYILRLIWRYRNKKNAEAPLAWIFRRAQPQLTSRRM